MKRFVLTLALLGLAGLMGCEADESAPKHSARNGHNFLTPNEAARNSAEKRETEKPQREMPTGANGEFPGQSAVTAPHPAIASVNQPTVQTLDQTSAAPKKRSPFNNTVPWAHTLKVPGTGMTIASDWGSLQAMPSYPHRAWPDTKVHYQSGDTKHNPIYFVDATTLLIGAPNNNYERGTGVSCPLVEASDIPWFYGNLVALPFLMVIDLPLAQRTTSTHWDKPVFRGHLPKDGEIAPTPVPGEIHWEYPVRSADQTTSTDTTTPATP